MGCKRSHRIMDQTDHLRDCFPPPASLLAQPQNTRGTMSERRKTMPLKQCSMPRSIALFVFIVCAILDPSIFIFASLQIYLFTSLLQLYLRSRHHTQPSRHLLLTKYFLQTFSSQCRVYHPFPANFLPGLGYILTEYVQTLPPSASRRPFSGLVVAPVGGLLILRASANSDGELAATQVLSRQNRNPMAEVLALGQRKIIEVPPVQTLYSNLIARLATLRYRSFLS